MRLLMWLIIIVVVISVLIWIALKEFRASFNRYEAAHQPAPGLKIANGGSKDISRLEVKYPGGSYLVENLAANGGHDLRPILFSDEIKLNLEITYADGTQCARSIETNIGHKPAYFQLLIKENAELAIY